MNTRKGNKNNLGKIWGKFGENSVRIKSVSSYKIENSVRIKIFSSYKNCIIIKN